MAKALSQYRVLERGQPAAERVYKALTSTWNGTWRQVSSRGIRRRSPCARTISREARAVAATPTLHHPPTLKIPGVRIAAGGRSNVDNGRDKPLPIEEVVDLGIQIVTRLHKCTPRHYPSGHQTANLMVTPEGQAKILTSALQGQTRSDGPMVCRLRLPPGWGGWAAGHVA